ncbi:MAG: hypothetical protein R2825_30965 [Saprospiraceae bacterium]
MIIVAPVMLEATSVISIGPPVLLVTSNQTIPLVALPLPPAVIVAKDITGPTKGQLSVRSNIEVNRLAAKTRFKLIVMSAGQFNTEHKSATNTLKEQLAAVELSQVEAVTTVLPGGNTEPEGAINIDRNQKQDLVL